MDGRSIRVVRGRPTDDEIAAVVVVVRLLLTRAPVPAAVPSTRPVPAGWTLPPRQHPTPGPTFPAR